MDERTMHRKWVLIPVDPAGSSAALVCREGGRSGFEPVPFHAATPAGDRLRELRVHGGKYLDLRTAAARVGLPASQLSGLEGGRYMLSAEQWAELEQAIKQAAGTPSIALDTPKTNDEDDA